MAFKPQKWNPLRLIRRSETVRCMIFGHMGRKFSFPTLIKDGDFIRDVGKDRVYGPVRLRPLFDQDGKPVYLAHRETGAPLETVTANRRVKVNAMDGWTATPIYNDENESVYLFDEYGKPAEVEIDISVLQLKTDPELMGLLTDKTLLTNALNRQPAMALIIMAALATLFLGILIGQGMAG